MTSLTYHWNDFVCLKVPYEAGQSFTKKSSLKKTITEIEERLAEFKKCFSSLLAIDCVPTMSSFALCQTYLKKPEGVKDLLIIIGKINCLISADFFKRLRKRISQQQEIKNSEFVRNSKELSSLACKNDTDFTWSKAFKRIMEIQNSRIQLSLPTTELFKIASLISRNIVTLTAEIEIQLSSDQIKEITRMLTVIYSSSNASSAFINIHELVFTPGVLDL